MSTAPHARAGFVSFILGYACLQTGCCQYYCGQQVPVCGPVATQPAAIRYGAVCEAPGSAVVTSTPSRSSTIADSPRPRVVVSEPSGGRLAGRSGWRRSDPENFATTRVEGAIDEDSVIR